MKSKSGPGSSGRRLLVYADRARALGPQTLMYGYVGSRVLHAYALGTAKTHDLRAVFFTIGSFIVIGMSLYTLIFALRV